MTRPDEIEGVVLCRVGDHQIAFPAAAVGTIDQWEPGAAPAPNARAAFGMAAASGKVLLRGGFALVVDGLEIVTDPTKLLPVPAMLLGAVGGSLRGFIQAHDRLVPLLGLAEFSTFVQAGGA